MLKTPSRWRVWWYVSMYVYFPKWSTPTIIIIPIITVDEAITCKSNSDDQSLQQHLKFSVSEAFHFSPIKVMVCWLNTDWRPKECLLEVYRDGKDAFCCHLIFFSKHCCPKTAKYMYFTCFKGKRFSDFLFFIMYFLPIIKDEEKKILIEETILLFQRKNSLSSVSSLLFLRRKW